MKIINKVNKSCNKTTYKSIKKGTNIFKTVRGEYIVKKFISYNRSEILFRSFNKNLVKSFLADKN